MPANEEQSRQAQITRDGIVGAARQLFIEQGYAATKTEDVVRRAAVTRGALYHHFADKRDLFQSVFEAVQQDFVDHYTAATSGRQDPWDRLRKAVLMFMDAAAEPEVRQIILIDGPAVLGWDTWQELTVGYTPLLFETAIEGAVKAGTIDPVPVAPLAHMLMAAFKAGGLLVATAPDPKKARREVAKVADRLLEGLRSPGASAGRT